LQTSLITPESRSIEAIDINDREDIAKLIGFDTIESDAVGTAGDRLYFDEECFLRGTSGRFQIDSVIPVSGKAVIVGTTDEGTTLRDVVTDINSLRSRIKYLLVLVARMEADRAGIRGFGQAPRISLRCIPAAHGSLIAVDYHADWQASLEIAGPIPDIHNRAGWSGVTT